MRQRPLRVEELVDQFGALEEIEVWRTFVAAHVDSRLLSAPTESRRCRRWPRKRPSPLRIRCAAQCPLTLGAGLWRWRGLGMGNETRRGGQICAEQVIEVAGIGGSVACAPGRHHIIVV